MKVLDKDAPAFVVLTLSAYCRPDPGRGSEICMVGIRVAAALFCFRRREMRQKARMAARTTATPAPAPIPALAATDRPLSVGDELPLDVPAEAVSVEAAAPPAVLDCSLAVADDVGEEAAEDSTTAEVESTDADATLKTDLEDAATVGDAGLEVGTGDAVVPAEASVTGVEVATACCDSTEAGVVAALVAGAGVAEDKRPADEDAALHWSAPALWARGS